MKCGPGTKGTNGGVKAGSGNKGYGSGSQESEFRSQDERPSENVPGALWVEVGKLMEMYSQPF